MTQQEFKVADGVAKNLGAAARMIEALASTLLTVLDAGGRQLLEKEHATEMDELVGNAGVRAKEYQEMSTEAQRLFQLVAGQPGDEK